ncbi:glycosyltransferase [uncultured Psychrobacter sp.]|uniref:glycosyltransferase n=1 Tax=uncultured Psychrobacter sp. TaxID=259303 RepID=UPI00262308B9|nr:glycosyltransferase [uncultured Psychrobacter sp.]
MSKIKVLYLSYTGLLEPLGRSQILAYLSRLADEYQFTIISFEKAEDLAKTDELQALKKECEHYGINWQPKTYHHKPRLLATLWDLSSLIYHTWQLSRSNRAHHIHCRSYIPAIAAWLVSKQTQVPFIFDMRALWLEEMIEAGRLNRHSPVHKVLEWLETKLLKDAAHVVSLTEAAVNYLQQQQPQLNTQKFSVITTCVDLERFKLSTVAIEDKKLGTMGTVISGWYHLDWLFLSLKTQLRKDKDATFKIVTRDSAQALRTMAQKYEIEPSKLEILSSSPNDIAKNIADIKAGLLYFTAGISKLGSAPTRLGEFLACGIPVIGNSGVGDMASLIERYQVGVVIENGSQHAIDEALEKLDILYQDKDLSQRCRDAAEDYFSADKGAERYRQIYRNITSHEKR